MLSEVPNCIIDCRISSTKQASGGGLGDQLAICENFRKSKGWNVIKIFSKVYSGRSEERADFEEILEFIKECKKSGIEILYYLVKSIDRFTRDGAVTLEEMKSRLEFLGVQLVDAHGIIQPPINTLGHLGFEYGWSKKSPSGTVQIMEAQRAKDEVTDILSRMIGAEIRLVQEGYKVRAPHDGFINEVVYVNGQRKMIETPDPKRAHFFIQMFELRANNGLSDQEIVNKINALGYLSKPRKKWSRSRESKGQVVGEIKGKPLTVKRFQAIISRTIYAGINIEKWTHNKPLKQKYDGLVSIETFNKANRGKVLIKEIDSQTVEVLYNQKDPTRQILKRQKFNPLYKFDKMLLCPEGCGKPPLSSKNTGKRGVKYPSYHCNRNHYWRVPQEQLEGAVTKYLTSLKFEEGYLEAFELVLLDKYREREIEILSTSSKVSENISDLQAQQAKAVSDYRETNSSVIRKKLEEEIEELENKINSARTERQKMDIEESDIKDYIRYIKTLMEHPVEILADNSNPYRQKALWGLFFEQIPTYSEILNGTPKLSLALRASNTSGDDKSLDVTLQRVELCFHP